MHCVLAHLLWFGRATGAARAVWLESSLTFVIAGAVFVPGLCFCYVVYCRSTCRSSSTFPGMRRVRDGVPRAVPPADLAPPHIEAVSAPDPALAGRTACSCSHPVGFGKFKFIGSAREDSGFSRASHQPDPPSRLAWYGHKAAAAVLKLGLACLFIVEIPLTVLALVPGVSS